MTNPIGTRPPKGPARPGRPGRPPRPTTRSATMPEGQKLIKQMRNLTGQRTIGPGEPPPGFVSGTTSAEEWLVYWALAKIFGDPLDPREPPFFGSRQGTWSYQEPYLGGRSLPGGAVIDYVVYTPLNAIGIRLQTERFHLMADAFKQGTDALQRVNLMRSGYLIIVDVFSPDIIEDSTGETAIRVLRDAIGLVQRPDPNVGGTVRRSTLGRIM